MNNAERLRAIVERRLGSQINAGRIDDLVEDMTNEGVLAPPCKVGDMVYSIGWFDATVKEEKILYFIYYSYSNNFVFVTDVGYFDANQIGKFIFLTRQAADQSLKERET